MPRVRLLAWESVRSPQMKSADEMQKIALHPAMAAKHGTSLRLQRVIKIFYQHLIKQRGARNTRGVAFQLNQVDTFLINAVIRSSVIESNKLLGRSIFAFLVNHVRQHSGDGVIDNAECICVGHLGAAQNNFRLHSNGVIHLHCSRRVNISLWIPNLDSASKIGPGDSHEQYFYSKMAKTCHAGDF